jgi:hypothetical protein
MRKIQHFEVSKNLNTQVPAQAGETKQAKGVPAIASSKTPDPLWQWR